MDKFKAHILVVDDDDGIRSLVKKYLNENDYLVTTADSAEVYANDDGSGNAGWIEVGAGGAVVGDKGQIRCNNDTIEENLDLAK